MYLNNLFCSLKTWNPRLIPIVVVFLTMSCSTNNKTDSSAVDSNHTKIEENSLTLLIAGDLSPSVSQIIQCSDKSLKHGFATVIHPFDTIQKQDIIWEPNFEVDGIEYPIKERVLNHKERETIAYLLSELKTKSYFEPSSVSTSDSHSCSIPDNELFNQ